ncbi:MAG: aldo/keto reductase [Chloroflexi bacterium HGW-Chloroflexi-6]|nr:MAG: aldo/keto reductase [Chloroflexi bacterium HGW-Chloroflexi-6]
MTTNTMPLRMRVLGKSKLQISEIGFGLWAAGGDAWGATDDSQVLNAIDYALEHGVNFYDTADVYGAGHSEELLGRAMQGRREQFIVATKIGWRDFDGEGQKTAYTSLEKFIAGVESNLKRLNTDFIDLIQSHIDFRDPTMEIFLEGFQRLQQAGKVKAYGVSTSNFEYLKAFNADGGCATLQIDYSILNRTAEKEILPYCQENNIGVIVRGALAMGILAGKFSAETRFADGDFRRRWHDTPDEYQVFLKDLETVESLRGLVQGQEKSLAHLALQFVLQHPAVTTVIPGIKDISQAEKNIAAGLLSPLSAAEMDFINKLVTPGQGRKIWPA